MRDTDDSDGEKKRILAYFLGISLSLIAMVGGFLVFILLLLEVHVLLLTGLFSAYVALGLSIAMTFLHRPLLELGVKKFFGIGSGFFLLTSIALFLNYFMF